MRRIIPLIAIGISACTTEKILEPSAEFTLAPRDVLIQEGMQLQVKPLFPLDAPQPTGAISWQSSAPQVVSVDANGTITAEAPGTASIIASSDTREDSTRVTVQERTGGTMVAAAAGTCGLTSSAALCWGENRFGQTGTRDPAIIVYLPTAVVASVTWRSLDAGWNHACGVDTQFDIYCWGLNAVGQLGMGTESDPVIPSKKVQSEKKFVQVATGGGEWQPTSDVEIFASQATCGLTREGEAYCWGRLGNPLTSGQLQSSTPQPVAPGLRFASISVGNGYACGISIERRAYCWGNNELGQLGRARAQFDRSAKPVEADVQFERISAGGIHACAIAVDGSAYCWGANASLQLGAATTEECNFRGVAISCRSRPAAVNTTFKFKSVSASRFGPAPSVFVASAGYESHTCGITTENDIVCWGSNVANKIVRRINFDEPFNLPPARLPIGEKFRQVVTGASHTCAVLVNGRAWCWGAQSKGQLGVPENSSTFGSAVEVAGGHVFR